MDSFDDPLLWIAAGGLLVAAASVGWLAVRGLLIALAVGAVLPLTVWLVAVEYVILKDGGTSPSSRFTIGGGLVMGVGTFLIAWVMGAMPGVLVGSGIYALRNAPKKLRLKR